MMYRDISARSYQGWARNLKVKKEIILALAFASAVFSSSVLAAEKAAECHGCNSGQKRSLAISTADSAANFGVDVYIIDFTGEQLSRYFVLSGNPLRPELQKYYENLPKNVIALSEEEAQTRRGTVTTVELSLTRDQSRVYGDIITYVNYLEEHGFSLRSATRADRTPLARDAFDIPAGLGFDSAFDVIDTPAASRQIGILAQQSDGRIGLFGRLGVGVSAVLPVLDTFVNLETEYEFTFSDGSRALWSFGRFSDLEVIPGTFRDTNNNSIPENAGDVSRGFLFGGGGLPDNNPTMNNMRDRIGNFGFGFDFSGGSGFNRCTFTCDDSAMRCVVTCSP